MPVWGTFVNAFASCIPSGVWSALKKLVKPEKIIVTDLAFNISTKYTPFLMVLIFCCSLGNQYYRSFEIDCATSSYIPGIIFQNNGGKGSSGGNQDGWGGNGGHGGNTKPNNPSHPGLYEKFHSELNDYCWNIDTFLVEKALTPKFRGKVTYPGVHGYSKGKDKIIKQGYYKFIWLIVTGITIVSFLPFLILKCYATSKIERIVEADGNSQRVSEFIALIGVNSIFGKYYLFCKILATITPAVAWIYLICFIGSRYTWYGIDVISYHLTRTSEDPWPNPMDVVFPKMAKCEWTKFGYSGDRETMAIQCQLPMNNITQWTFLFVWWWCVLVFVINFVSCISFLFLGCCGFYRTSRYRSLVAITCDDDLKGIQNYSPYYRQFSNKDLININLSFGDWIICILMKKNLESYEFKEFLRQLVRTRNPAICLNETPDRQNSWKSRNKHGAANKLWAATAFGSDNKNGTLPNGDISKGSSAPLIPNSPTLYDPKGNNGGDGGMMNEMIAPDIAIMNNEYNPQQPQPHVAPQMGFITPQGTPQMGFIRRPIGFVDPNKYNYAEPSGDGGDSSLYQQAPSARPPPPIRMLSPEPIDRSRNSKGTKDKGKKDNRDTLSPTTRQNDGGGNFGGNDGYGRNNGIVPGGGGGGNSSRRGNLYSAPPGRPAPPATINEASYPNNNNNNNNTMEEEGW